MSDWYSSVKKTLKKGKENIATRRNKQTFFCLSRLVTNLSDPRRLHSWLDMIIKEGIFLRQKKLCLVLSYIASCHDSGHCNFRGLRYSTYYVSSACKFWIDERENVKSTRDYKYKNSRYTRTTQNAFSPLHRGGNTNIKRTGHTCDNKFPLEALFSIIIIYQCSTSIYCIPDWSRKTAQTLRPPEPRFDLITSWTGGRSSIPEPSLFYRLSCCKNY